MQMEAKLICKLPGCFWSYLYWRGGEIYMGCCCGFASCFSGFLFFGCINTYRCTHQTFSHGCQLSLLCSSLCDVSFFSGCFLYFSLYFSAVEKWCVQGYWMCLCVWYLSYMEFYSLLRALIWCVSLFLENSQSLFFKYFFCL